MLLLNLKMHFQPILKSSSFLACGPEGQYFCIPSTSWAAFKRCYFQVLEEVDKISRKEEMLLIYGYKKRHCQVNLGFKEIIWVFKKAFGWNLGNNFWGQISNEYHTILV